MPKLRILSADAILKIFLSFGFAIESQRGSHVKVVRILNAERQVLIVPNHREIDKGTVHAIFRQASRYIDEGELRTHFFAE